jgi:putative oxidoreductase
MTENSAAAAAPRPILWRPVTGALGSAVLLALRLGLAVMFGYAAYAKILDMRTFAEEVANYQVLPASLVSLAAASVVGVETLTALLLIAGFRVRAAAGMSLALLIVFIGALSQAMTREIDLRCGCFGGIEPATWFTVWRDVALLLPALVLLVKGGGRFGLDRS